jgi:hypothetical protein
MPRVDGEYQVPYPDVIPDTTIESIVHNGIVHDLVFDANFPRPVPAGGTNANNVTSARANLAVEVRGIAVINYDSHVFEVGSFYSAAGATGAPTADVPYVGFCLSNFTSGDLYLSAISQTTGIVYARRRTAGVWNTWTTSPTVGTSYVLKAGDVMSGSLTLNFTVSATDPYAATNVAYVTAHLRSVIDPLVARLEALERRLL